MVRMWKTLGILFMMSIQSAVSFPAHSPRVPSRYTAEQMHDVYSENVKELLSQPRALLDILEMFMQVIVEQSKKIDILERSHITLRTELGDLSRDSTYVKKYVLEQIAVHHSDSPYTSRSGLGKTSNLFLPWDNYFKERTKLTVDDVIAINDSLIGLNLRVDALHSHLEEVETIALEVKTNTADGFINVINAILPELEKKVEAKYTQVMKIKLLELSRTTQIPSEIVNPATTPGANLSCEQCLSLHQNISQSAVMTAAVTDAIILPTTTTSTPIANGTRALYSRAQLSKLYETSPTKLKKKVSVPVQRTTGSRNKVLGSWMMDGYLQSPKVWMLQGYRKLTTLIEFSSIIEFAKGSPSKLYNITVTCGGTGHIMYNGSLYCPGFKSNRIYKYDLVTGLANITKLKGEDIHGKYGYSIGGFNDIDLLTDSIGIWAIYTNTEAMGNIIVVKLNATTLETEFIEQTDINQTSVMNSFMILGNLYTISTKEGNIRATKAWSIHATGSDGVEQQRNSIKLEKKSSAAIISADYNPRLHRLCTWSVERIGLASLKWLSSTVCGYMSAGPNPTELTKWILRRAPS